jgi:nucleoid-associated protein YgaU
LGVPPIEDPGPVSAPAPEIAAMSAKLGPAFELAQAEDAKPGSPPIEEAAAPAPLLPVAGATPAPVETPDAAGPAIPPESTPAIPAPQPSPALETSPAEPSAISPSPDLSAAPDAGAGPEVLPSAPAPTPAASPTPAPGASPSLAAPAAAGPAVSGAAGLLGLGAGLGAAVKGLADKAAEHSAPDAADAKPAPDAKPMLDAAPPADAPEMKPEAPHAPEPQPIRAIEPIPTPSPATPSAASPSPSPAAGDFPPLREVPEGSASPAVETPAPRAEPKPEPEEAPDHRELAPIRRSGGMVFNDIGAEPSPQGDPFDPDAEIDTSFDAATLPRRGQDAGRDARAAKAAPKAAPGGEGKLDTVLHKVELGENFFSISQSYYSSGRYYRALSHANKYKDPRDLVVGAVIRVPPPEDLDPAFIDPPGTRYGPKPSPSGARAAESPPKATAATPIRRTRRGRDEVEVELNLPAADPAAERTSSSSRRGRDDAFDDFDRPEPEAASRNVPTRPVHKVRPDETLRTIARDRLGTGRRADEILELNRDVIDDPSELIVGQVLQLPEDASVERPRSRR